MKNRKRRCQIWAALGLVSVMLLAAASGCAPKAADETPANNSNAAASEATLVDFTWSADADCSMCHGNESASVADNSTIAGIHGAEGNTCATCHSDEASLAKVHEGATADSKTPKHLKKTKIDEQVCLACHGSLEEIAQKTAESTALTDSEGLTVNPHALPSNSDHDMITCSNCHSMHSSEPIADTAKDKCLTCHHKDVFECGTCHEA